MMTQSQIFAEIAKDNVPAENDSSLTMTEMVNRLDEATQKFNEFQNEVSQAFEKQVEALSNKIDSLGHEATHEESTDEQSNELD